MMGETRQNHAEPLAGFRLFETRDIDIARAEVARKFCSHSLSPGADHRDFGVIHNHVGGLSLSLNDLRYGSEVEINPGELSDFYLVQIPLRGSAEVRNGCRTVQASRRVATVLNPTHATRMTWHGGCEKLLLQIDRVALQEMAEALVGRALPQALVFDPEIDLSTQALRGWLRNLRFSIDLARQGQAYGDSFHRNQPLLEEELIVGLLSAQRNSISHMLETAPRHGASAQVKRARSYILDNLSEPLTIARIACEAGCSIRSLQLGFQSHFGCTPGQFLLRERLNHAHYLLQSRRRDTRVSSAAFESGFSHLGRFSIAYRKAFGQSPRDTVQKHRLA